MDELLQKLALSKAIMQKHDTIGRGGSKIEEQRNINYNVDVQDFDVPEASYNIPQELAEESKPKKMMDGKAPQKDAILQSKLPDEIKRLMIENPISVSNPLMGGGPVLSDELVEKASKLMGTTKKQELREETSQPVKKVQNSFDSKEMRKIMKEVVQEVLKENGLIVESTDKTTETIVLKVGQHIFEGKISKIKKLKS
jgi:hypothetical protein